MTLTYVNAQILANGGVFQTGSDGELTLTGMVSEWDQGMGLLTEFSTSWGVVQNERGTEHVLNLLAATMNILELGGVAVLARGGAVAAVRSVGNTELPLGYTRNIDGSIIGPAGGRAWETGYVNAYGQQVFQRASGGYYVVNSSGVQVSVGSPKVHGNTLDNTPTEIYRRVSEFDDIYLKTGIANDAMRRYAVDELGGDIIIPLGTRPRVQAAAIERFIVERWPGPLNLEPWAGKRNPTHPNYDPNYIPYHLRGN